ncbi:MAG: redoxin domain-containing protein [Oligoflexales bacterium]|nr:redoxin domain-containing protein [Oligoflexales bacterium]
MDRGKIKGWLRRRGVDLLFLVAIVVGLNLWQTRGLLPGDLKKPAPSFSLKGIDGKIYDLSAAKGRKTILYFFAPWCDACKAATSNIVDLGEETRVYAVALSWEDEGSVVNFAKEHRLENIPVLLGTNEVMEGYQISSFPTFYFLDEKGSIKTGTVGYTSRIGIKLRN